MAEVGQRISASSAEQENKWPKVKGLQMANLHYCAENSRDLMLMPCFITQFLFSSFYAKCLIHQHSEKKDIRDIIRNIFTYRKIRFHCFVSL